MVRAKRLAVAALIAVPLTFALLGALGLVVGALHLNGIDLGAIDPTEQAFTVTIHNDLSEPVVLKQCDTVCGPNFHETDRLAPGASVPVNTSSENVPNWWVVVGNDGKPLGCLNLLYDHKAPDVVLNTSQMTACPK